MQKKNIAVIGAVVLVIAVGAGAFYGGIQYGASKAKATQVSAKRNFVAGVNGSQLGQNSGQGTGQNSGQRMGGANGAGGFMNGDIISKDDKSITVKSQDGSSKIIFFSDSTTVGKTVDSSAADLATGQQVMVNGKANADGTIAAQNIQIRPAQTN